MIVVSAESMDDETFLLHFEKRHSEQLAGLKTFGDTIRLQPELVGTYRRFHERLHRLEQVEEGHEHEG